MPPFVRNWAPISPPHDRRPLAVGGFAAIVLVGFLIAPGNVAWKTHVALHGLFRQRGLMPWATLRDRTETLIDRFGIAASSPDAA